ERGHAPVLAARRDPAAVLHRRGRRYRRAGRERGLGPDRQARGRGCRPRGGRQGVARALLAALALAANATDQLAAATGLPLVPHCVLDARAGLAKCNGTAKTTGAGGGDVAVAVIPDTEDVTRARRLLIEVGCQPLD